MKQLTQHFTQQRPEILVTKNDYNRLYTLIEKLPASDATARLADELERADLIESDEIPENVVAMHSTVTFTLVNTHKTYTYQLVYPHEANAEAKLSVLTPVGSALLGLAVGQEIEWPLDKNKSTRVRIDATTN